MATLQRTQLSQLSHRPRQAGLRRMYPPRTVRYLYAPTHPHARVHQRFISPCSPAGRAGATTSLREARAARPSCQYRGSAIYVHTANQRDRLCWCCHFLGWLSSFIHTTVALGVCPPKQVPPPQESTDCPALRAIFQNDVRLPVPVADIMAALTELGMDRVEGAQNSVVRGFPRLPNQSRLRWSRAPSNQPRYIYALDDVLATPGTNFPRCVWALTSEHSAAHRLDVPARWRVQVVV